jgi:hypothetical protein
MIWVILGLVQASVKLSLKLGYDKSIYVTGVSFTFGLIVFSLVSPFIRVYVVGHEMTHWLAAKVFRRKTSGFKVSKTTGSVRIERPNMWIILAPYFIPIYTIIWILTVKFAGLWFTAPWAPIVLYGGVGITYAYHIVMTVFALSKSQSDLRFYGHIFSLCLIIMINISILYGGLSFFSGNRYHVFLSLRDSFRTQWTFICRLIN